MHMPVKIYEPVRLKRGRRWLTYGIGLGVWLTGVVWLAFHYFLRTQTEFGPAENPLTHWWLAAHGLFAFAALWLLGLLWGQHIAGAWQTGRHRKSGSLLLALSALLIASGYLLYYAGGDGTRSLVSIIHWATGLAVPLLFLLHRFIRAVPLRARMPSRADDDGMTEGLV